MLHKTSTEDGTAVTATPYPARGPEQRAKVSALVPRYRSCLSQLEEVLAEEKAGRLMPTTPVPAIPGDRALRGACYVLHLHLHLHLCTTAMKTHDPTIYA
jgi:hypothetical protein